MPIRNPKDFWSGLLFLGVGGAVVLLARNYQLGTASKMGPGYFPTALGSLLAVVGLIAVARSFIRPGTAIETFHWRLLLIVLVAAGALILVKANQQATWFVYPGEDRSHAEESPADYGLAYENVSLTTSDGVPIAAWYIPSQNGAAIILQHGYRGNRGSMLDIAAILARHGYGVLMMDARAHGDSGGEMVTYGLLEAPNMLL